MCGPVDDDGERKAKREKFLEDFESACFETFRESSIFSPSAPLRILDSDQQTISSSALPKSRRNGRNKNPRGIWIH